MLIRTLLALARPVDRRRFARLIEDPGIVVTPLGARQDLRKVLSRGDFDLLLLGRGSIVGGPDSFIASIRALPDRPEIIVIADSENPEERAVLLGTGCLAVLYSGLPDPVLKHTLETLVARRREDAVSRLRGDRPEERYSLDDFVSASPAMKAFLEMPRRVAPSDTSLLILGETGVGKERLARAIHAESPRRGGPFLAINCGALPESLLESELFGHEEGAFTGASRSHRGYFELAHRGTLFLDEIGEMPIHLQVKLLRVLEDRSVRRVGSEKTTRVDVRIMAASNRDLEAEVKARRFRADLFFRLAVVSLTVPPLRERREDLPRLVEDYIQRFRIQTNRRVTRIQPAALEALLQYAWPGNVRELINVIEQACLLCRTETIELRDLPGRISGIPRTRGGPPGGSSGPEWEKTALIGKSLPDARREWVTDFERRYLVALLGATGGRIGPAARRAGINERSLFDLMRRHDIRKEAFKQAPGSEAAPPKAQPAPGPPRGKRP